MKFIMILVENSRVSTACMRMQSSNGLLQSKGKLKGKHDIKTGAIPYNKLRCLLV